MHGRAVHEDVEIPRFGNLHLVDAEEAAFPRDHGIFRCRQRGDDEDRRDAESEAKGTLAEAVGQDAHGNEEEDGAVHTGFAEAQVDEAKVEEQGRDDKDSEQHKGK